MESSLDRKNIKQDQWQNTRECDTISVAQDEVELRQTAFLLSLQAVRNNDVAT